MTAKKATTLDQPWAYSHLSTPVILGVLVWGVAATIDATNTPSLWVVAAGALLTVVSPMAALGINSPLSTRWFTGILFASLTGYLGWTGSTTAFQRNAVLPVVLGVIVFGAWWRVIAHHSAQRDLKAEQAQREQDKLLARNELTGWIAAVGLKGVTASGDRVPYPDPTAGYQQPLDLPADGSVTFKQLVAKADTIETAARAEFPIRFQKGGRSHQVIGHVILRDVLADDVPYPIDRAPKSIHQPMPLGLDETGTVVTVTMRELAGLIGGTRGSGKSALLNSKLAYLVGCSDAIVWMIDGKGGRTARPWLKPFLDGIGKAAIDYVAVTPQESGWLLLAARAAIAIRSMGDGEKVIPTRGKPAIILIVEESSLITGMGAAEGGSKRTQTAKEIVVLGRSEAVDAVFVVQRGTVSMLGSGDMKSQLQLRIGLGVESPDDASRIFPDSSMAHELYRFAKEEKYRGVFLLKAPGHKSVLPVKGFWLEHDAIAGLAMSLAPHRPDLDKETADHVHETLLAAGAPGGYYGRWDRFARDMGIDLPRVSDVPVSPVSPVPAGDMSQSGQRQTVAERLGLPESPIVAQIRADRDKAREAKKAAESPVPVSPEEELATLEALWAVPAAEGEHVPVDETAQVVPVILLTLVQVFGALGAEKLHTKRILDELPGGQEPATRMTAKAFGLLMGHCGVAPLPNDFTVDGERGRGYAVAEVLRAVARARDGATLNPAAFDWPDPQD